MKSVLPPILWPDGIESCWMKHGNGELHCHDVSRPRRVCRALLSRSCSRLAPIVSPMVAAARVAAPSLRPRRRPSCFIGPCIAKKGEAASEGVEGDVAAVLTFAELRQMLADAGIRPGTVEPSEFDPPWSGPGGFFPISRGLLQAAGITEDLMNGEVMATDGRTNFVEAIQAVESNSLDVRLLEVLCCNGCIMGAGMTTNAAFSGGAAWSEAMSSSTGPQPAKNNGKNDMARFSDVDLSREFHALISASPSRLVRKSPSFLPGWAK